MAEFAAVVYEPVEQQHRVREEELGRLNDGQLRREVADYSRRTWSRPGRARAHFRKHRTQIATILQGAVGEAAYEELTAQVLSAADRVFTERTVDQEVAYHFARMVGDDAAIIVTVRGAFLRTVHASRSLNRWLMRHPAVVEVTDRVRGD